MIAEATQRRAPRRRAVRQRQGTSVGGIRSATQGYFSIGARDGDADRGRLRRQRDSPLQKVRVVTTIEFYLD